MANPTLTGFWPKYNLDGGDIVLRWVQVASAPATAIFKGDCVVHAGDGTWTLATAGAGNYVDSVAVGFRYVRADGKMTYEKYVPSGTAYTATDQTDGVIWMQIVANMQDVVFETTVDEAIALTDLNSNYAIATNAGSTTTGLSGHVLDATGKGAGATLQWRVIDFVKRPGLDWTLTNPHVECMVNYSHITPALSTTGH